MREKLTYLNVAVMAFMVAAVMLMTSCSGNRPGAPGGSQSDSTGTAILSFNSAEHDFGKVKAGEKVASIFIYTNSGSSDLVITHASASCGCTVPKFSKKPVPPGGSGTIEVVFDTSGREGVQSKTVVIQSNAENNIVILRIIAEVITR